MPDLQSKQSQIYFKVFQILNPNGITLQNPQDSEYQFLVDFSFYIFEQLSQISKNKEKSHSIVEKRDFLHIILR